MNENNLSKPIILEPGVTVEIKDETPFNHQYYTTDKDFSNIYPNIMDSPVPPIGDMIDRKYPALYINDIEEHNRKQKEMLRQIMSEFVEATKPILNFKETKLLKVYNTKQLMMITEFMKKQFGVVIKNYVDLQTAFLARNGIIIYKKDLEKYKKEIGHVDDIVIELKDCEYVSILR